MTLWMLYLSHLFSHKPNFYDNDFKKSESPNTLFFGKDTQYQIFPKSMQQLL